MFTGIIKKVENVNNLKRQNKSFFATIGLPKNWRLKKGDSISVNGICSTVQKVTKKDFEVEYMPETISKTTVSNWIKGHLVNLEQSLKRDDSLDGHFVFGHIDAPGLIVEIEKRGSSKIFKIKAPKDLMKFIVSKGSIALDGVSLTISKVSGSSFYVSLVSYTLRNTNFNDKKVGQSINIETDMVAKYLFNILKNTKNAKS